LPDAQQEVYTNVVYTTGRLGARRTSAVLLLADLFGGSPTNAVAAAYLREEDVDLVSGCNLPMLMETLLKRSRRDVDLMRTALEAGITGVVDVGARVRQ